MTTDEVKRDLEFAYEAATDDKPCQAVIAAALARLKWAEKAAKAMRHLIDAKIYEPDCPACQEASSMLDQWEAMQR